MDIISNNAALIVIDVQQVLDDPDQGALNNPGAVQRIVWLLELWRKHRLPVFHVKYISPRRASPFHKDAPGSRLKDEVKPLPGEPLIVKHFECAFMQTGLAERLEKEKLHTLVFVGFYTDQCLAASVKAANNLGFDVHVAADATATTGCRGYNGKFHEAEDIWQMTLGSLRRDNISIIQCGDLYASGGHTAPG
jgi:nicotinamidase-related amidase